MSTRGFTAAVLTLNGSPIVITKMWFEDAINEYIAVARLVDLVKVVKGCKSRLQFVFISRLQFVFIFVIKKSL